MYYIHFVKSRENSSFFAANSASSRGKPGGFCVQFDLCFSGLQALKTPPALRTFPHPMRRCGRGRGLPGPLCRRPVLLRCLRRRPAPQPGTLRWARFLSDEKSGKESLRAFPPKDLPGVRGWSCVKPTVGPGPGGVTWMVWQIYGSAPFSVRQHRSFQGLTLVCGVPAAGSRASDTCQPKASLPEGAFCRALKSLPQIEIRAALRHTTIIHSSLFIIH